MPVSVANSQLIYDALKACDIRLLSALPETWLVNLIRMAEEDPEVTLDRLAKEEEGVGISAGAHLAGICSAMLMRKQGGGDGPPPGRGRGTRRRAGSRSSRC
jgi:sulfopyruvate decarboxylase subunit alpha